MLKELSKFADHLDSKGLKKEADLLDDIIIRIADDLSDEDLANAKDKDVTEMTRIIADINSQVPRSNQMQSRLYWRARLGEWDDSLLSPFNNHLSVIYIGFSSEFWNTYVPEFEPSMSKDSMNESRKYWALREVKKRLSPGFKIDTRFGDSGAAIGKTGGFGARVTDSEPTEPGTNNKPPDFYDLVAVKVVQDLSNND
jgi:hypothetical protein